MFTDGRSHRLAAALGTLLAAVPALAVAAQSPEPALQARLDRLAAQLEQKRQELHIPGMSFALVKDDQVVLSRGFGSAELETGRPVTEHTLFAAGSTTKAFTATLIGMLVDEGRMGWDDPPSKYLPYFHVSDPEVDAQLAIRDLLCHRVGLASMTMLWYGNEHLTRRELLEVVGGAKLLHPFRSTFNYSNMSFLAAGEAAAVAAGTDWDTLLAQRLFVPLGMTRSNTTLDAARRGDLALGYRWDADSSAHEHQPMRDVQSMAPAGAINSCAADMAQWVRFQLGRGEIDGKRLISPEQHQQTWTMHTSMGSGVDYGLGWMLRTWEGRQLVEHAGGIDGFTAEVALVPDEKLGFVLLMNLFASPLGGASTQLVLETMLGEWVPDGAAVAASTEDFEPMLGTYIGNFAHFHDAEFKVLVQNGKLAIDVPGQMIFEMEPPDAQGRRAFSLTDQISVVFNRDDQARVYSTTIHQSGFAFELPRQGAEFPLDTDLDAARIHLGTYRSDTLGEVRALIQNNRLAVDVPGQMVYELHPPDAEGRWAFRVKDSIWVRFGSAEAGDPVTMTMFQDGTTYELTRIAAAAEERALPSADEVMALVHRAAGAEHLGKLRGYRATGTIRFVHMGIEGPYTQVVGEGDQHRQDIDLGRFGRTRAACSGASAWVDSPALRFMELHGDLLEDQRREHPLRLLRDWRVLYEKRSVLREEEKDGQRVYVVRLKAASGPAETIYVDTTSGLIVAMELQPMSAIGVRVPTKLRLSDYRDVAGVKLPFHAETEVPTMGSMAVQIDAVEPGLDLPPSTFVLSPR